MPMLNHRMTVAFLMSLTFLQPANGRKMTLFDFTRMDNVNDWQEISDTVRTVGKSKATLVLQKTQVFQRAIFFTLLNPQPNGAGFAGKNNHYKAVLRHKGFDSNKDLSYEQFFQVPMSNEEFSTVSLKLDSFKPYYRGQEIPEGEPLDVEKITMFGLQVYGGVYLPFKQSGVSALEIVTIDAF
ncbi:hypothetical protein HZH66_008281 [Vespula vulgaris]|uniref:NADH:ubiquinone oxidoreductase intermediate-associated protein 30 domain-containing protein n=1 Tax=Vespula vulgaris TaxID=7454 RepID=A0A834JVF7_VESVU|nr:hypothetical protein HZH66_008281 [Vespula vulgaris]